MVPGETKKQNDIIDIENMKKKIVSIKNESENFLKNMKQEIISIKDENEKLNKDLVDTLKITKELDVIKLIKEIELLKFEITTLKMKKRWF